ncbi:tautomerase family protein [Nostoc sphaeroides CCNUC1]|uniref:Tautomerase family protein n=2 Tax=Nostoc sphaeroides TaxID=446679 RepID=A0A5P8W1G5_9NOSO|nr:tautomerase family protein [Nostoc sphaeroides CCNUC1]
MFEGRTVETKKELIRLLIKNINEKLNIPIYDIEITIFETPKSSWGIRGLPGDELTLNYKVEV